MVVLPSSYPLVGWDWWFGFLAPLAFVGDGKETPPETHQTTGLQTSEQRGRLIQGGVYLPCTALWMPALKEVNVEDPLEKQVVFGMFLGCGLGSQKESPFGTYPHMHNMASAKNVERSYVCAVA